MISLYSSCNNEIVRTFLLGIKLLRSIKCLSKYDEQCLAKSPHLSDLFLIGQNYTLTNPWFSGKVHWKIASKVCDGCDQQHSGSETLT